MPKIDLTTDELNQAIAALDALHKSAKRAQNSGKSPQIAAVYATEAANIAALGNKFIIAAAQKT